MQCQKSVIVNDITAGRRWASPLALLPALAVAAAPKCPLCLLAITSALGLGSVITTAWLWPLTMGMLGLTLATLGLAAWRGRGFGPSLLGVVAAGGILLGKFQFEQPLLLYGGMILLGLACLWNGWPRRTRPVRQSGVAPGCAC